METKLIGFFSTSILILLGWTTLVTQEPTTARMKALQFSDVVILLTLQSSVLPLGLTGLESHVSVVDSYGFLWTFLSKLL